MHRIKDMFSAVFSKGVIPVTLSVVFSVFFVVAVVQGATTISTNVSTGGTLAVTGLSSLSQASSTMFSANSAYFGGSATATISTAGVVSFPSTFSVTGLSTLLGGATTTTLTLLNGEVISNATDGVVQTNGIASSTSVTLLNGETITNATDGTITFGATNTVLVGTASSSAIKVGDEPATPTINGLVFGYCSFADVTSFTASTTQFFDCTTTPAGALLTTDRVFVQATSSFDAPFIIQSASSTGVSTINLRVVNTGLGTADATLGGASINFWAVR